MENDIPYAMFLPLFTEQGFVGQCENIVAFVNDMVMFRPNAVIEMTTQLREIILDQCFVNNNIFQNAQSVEFCGFAMTGKSASDGGKHGR